MVSFWTKNMRKMDLAGIVAIYIFLSALYKKNYKFIEE